MCPYDVTLPGGIRRAMAYTLSVNNAMSAIVALLIGSKQGGIIQRFCAHLKLSKYNDRE